MVSVLHEFGIRKLELGELGWLPEFDVSDQEEETSNGGNERIGTLPVVFSGQALNSTDEKTLDEFAGGRDQLESVIHHIFGHEVNEITGVEVTTFIIIIVFLLSELVLGESIVVGPDFLGPSHVLVAEEGGTVLNTEELSVHLVHVDVSL